MMRQIFRYISNGKVILLNSDNMNWVRMPLEVYEGESKDKDKFYRKLIETFDFNSKSVSQDIGTLHIITTKKCNLNCDFCAANSGPDVTTEDELSVEKIINDTQKFIDKLKPSLKKVVISGGEPLVKKNIEKLVEKMAESIGKENIVFQTNGLLLSKKLIDCLVERVSVIEISIENLFCNERQYKKMVPLFEQLKTKKVKLSFSYVLTPYNMKYLEEALNMAAQYNAFFQLRIVAPVGRGKNFSIKVLDQIKLYQRAVQFVLDKKYEDKNFINALTFNLSPKKHCGAVDDLLTIAPDGNVYMCPNLTSEKFVLGNIKEDVNIVLERYEEKKKNAGIKSLFYVNQIPKCKICPYKYFCCGECAANCVNDKGERVESIDCSLQKVLIYYEMFVKKDNYKNNFFELNEYLKYVVNNFEQICESDYFSEDIDVKCRI